MLIHRMLRTLGVASLTYLTACGIVRPSAEDGFLSTSTLVAQGWLPPTDMKDLPDMTLPSPKCAAAQGLSGDVLGDLCLDMDKTDTLTLMGLKFVLTAGAANCTGWAVNQSKLQPQGIVTNNGFVDCAFWIPAIPINSSIYPRVTISLVHQAVLSDATQESLIERVPASVPIWKNPSTKFDQRTIVQMDTTKIATGTNVQVGFRLKLPMNAMNATWTISSLAVLGNP